MATARGCRRSGRQDWLRVGAASAGVSALLLGISLFGPQVGIAAADSSGESSVSADPAESGTAAAQSDTTDGAADPAVETDAEDTADANEGDANDGDAVSDDLDEGTEDGDDRGADIKEDTRDTQDIEDTEDTQGTAGKVPSPPESAAGGSATEDRADPQTRGLADDPSEDSTTQSAANVAAPMSAPTWVPASDSGPNPGAKAVISVTPRARPALAPFDPEVRRLVVAERIDDFFSAAPAFIAGLPIDPAFKDWLNGALLLVRRTFLNQAPVVTPVQISGRISGPIAGNLNGVDSEGERVTYRLTQAPESGSVLINPDGSYTYTPGPGFDGTDSFGVAASDVGLNLNILDPFRRAATYADVLVNQAAIKFEFIYGTGSEYWTPEARQALHNSASALAMYFLVKDPVTLTYDIKGKNSPDSDTLASAFSALISSDAGFYPTVVQNKLLKGVDSNSAKADGEIEVNWAKSWALGESVGSDEYDFTSTIMHEAMHSFGFFSDVSEPGENTDQNWPVFARFVVTSRGAKPIGKDFEWHTKYDQNLTGGAGGLYFGGKNAVRAYKKRVPLYTPKPWAPGSSMSHLDDSTFVAPNEQMMNANTDTGPGIRTLSAIEIGIMTDLGYTMVPKAPPSYAALFVFVFFLRSRRRGISIGH